ncbi:MAG: guanylate kinase [Clostridia bacterium]|nr:guanylate kinase [Clostridia bacterium]
MKQTETPATENNTYTCRQLVVNFDSSDRHNRPGKFYLVSGPSGVGKNTLLAFALARIKKVYYLPSITTRPLRPMEEQGNPYFFTTVEEFKKMIESNVFLEWKKIHNGNYYGTHLPTIQYALENGYDLATDMDVLGCKDVRERFPDHVVTIFIAPPNLDELRLRLSKRDKDPAVTNKRLERVEMEMSHMQYYDYVVVNDHLEKAGKELVKIIQYHQQDPEEHRTK